MHMHDKRDMRMLERTSLGRPQWAVERLATAAAGAAVRPSSPDVEPLRLMLMAASVGPPARVGVGGKRVHGYLSAALTSALRRRCGHLHACWDVVSGCSRARNGVDVRPVQRGACQSELVGSVSGQMVCTCTPHMHAHHISAPHSRRLRGRRRGWRRQQRPLQRTHYLGPSSRGGWWRRRRRASDL